MEKIQLEPPIGAEEAGANLGISYTKTLELLRSRQLKGWKAGGQYFTTLSDVRDFREKGGTLGCK